MPAHENAQPWPVVWGWRMHGHTLSQLHTLCLSEVGPWVTMAMLLLISPVGVRVKISGGAKRRCDSQPSSSKDKDKVLEDFVFRATGEKIFGFSRVRIVGKWATNFPNRLMIVNIWAHMPFTSDTATAFPSCLAWSPPMPHPQHLIPSRPMPIGWMPLHSSLIGQSWPSLGQCNMESWGKQQAIHTRRDEMTEAFISNRVI